MQLSFPRAAVLLAALSEEWHAGPALYHSVVGTAGQDVAHAPIRAVVPSPNHDLVLPQLHLGEAPTAARPAVSEAATRRGRRKRAEPANIVFKDCPQSAHLDPSLQCANFSVPIDWRAADSDMINLSMVRLPARVPAQRIGNLFFNPGGPGLPPSRVMSIIGAGRRQNISASVRDRFDVIGLDPRGVGMSTPIMCDGKLSLMASAAMEKLDPLEQATLDAMLLANNRLARSCRAMTGPLFDKVDTQTVVQDLEAVRVALGDEPLNWLGQSYGTQVGVLYAALYPQKVRAMILDGVLDHSGSTASNLQIEQSSLEVTLKDFFTACQNDKACPLAGQDVAAVWAKVINSAKAGSLKAADCDGTNKTGCLPDVPVNNVVGLSRSMLFYEFARFRLLGNALKRAADGNGTDFATGLPTGDAAEDNEQYAFNAVICQDGTAAPVTSLAQAQEQAALSATFATLPGLDGFWRFRLLCSGWTAVQTNPRKQLDAAGLPNPVFIINTLRDPATSLVWAQSVHQQIPNSVLTYRQGSGHTTYFLGRESRAAMDDYLINLTVPPNGTLFPA